MSFEEQVPLDALTEIFSFLPAEDTARCAGVSHQWRKAANKSYLWKHYLQAEWLVSSNNNDTKPEEDEEEFFGQHEKKIYLRRMQEVLQWTQHYKLMKHHLFSNQYSFFTRLLFQFKMGLKGIISLLLSPSSNQFVAPKYLHKDYVDDHYKQLLIILNSSRWVSDTLALVFVLCALYFNIFTNYIQLSSSTMFLCLLALVVAGFYVVFKGQRIKVDDPSENSNRLLHDQRVNTCVSITLCHLFIIISMTISVFHIEGEWTFKALLSIPIAILHAVDQMLPTMIFETYFIDRPSSSVAGSPASTTAAPVAPATQSPKFLLEALFVTDERTIIAKKYTQNRNAWYSTFSLPLVLLIGITIGTGGPRFIYEALIVIVLIIIAMLTNGSRISGDLSKFVALIVVLLYTSLDVLVVTSFMLILYLKMRYGWHLKKQGTRANLKHYILVFGFQVLSYLMIGLLITSAVVALVYF